MFALLSDEELKEAYGDYRESIGREEEKIEDIQKIMNNLNLTAEQAMTALRIAKEDFEKDLSRL
ncbi:hypothetical protein [Pseudobutyrivibrio ruminis]|uniref:hypothetical protein n=1 Tax=Pseudobutyrivibrio ruminis TaxID=46206 RepID=UPI0004112D39|nr:hypothetical protein [Pseudobutyrivibrio ruminis]